MYNPVEVQWFSSAMAGAPALPGNTKGSIIGVLDACLTAGFNSQTLTSLVVSGGIATATKTSHGFLDYTVVLISGATPSDLNGKKRITRVNDNSFTFEAVGIADGTATGTILAKMASAGWTKTTVSTNVCYYTKPNLLSTTWALYVDDNYTGYAYWGGRLPDGTIFYSNGTYSVYCARTTVSENKEWILFCDGRAVFLWIDVHTSTQTNWRLHYFCDLISGSYNNNNDFCVGGCYSSTASILSSIDGTSGGVAGAALAPGIPAYQIAMRGNNISYSGYSTTGIDGTAGSDGFFHCAPIEIWDNFRTGPRGIIPGLFSSMHDYDLNTHGLVLTNPQTIRAPQLKGHKIKIMAVQGNQNGMMAIDITGPWYPIDHYYGNYRIYGTAKKQGATGRFPLALVVRDSGEIIRKTLSASDGTFAFNNIDYIYQGYTVIEYDGEITDPLNAAIADLVTPVAMP